MFHIYGPYLSNSRIIIRILISGFITPSAFSAEILHGSSAGCPVISQKVNLPVKGIFYLRLQNRCLFFEVVFQFGPAGSFHDILYIDLTCLFVRSKTAVSVNPAEQMARSMVLPKI